MADMVQAQKKIALLHRYPLELIKETNAAFPYLEQKGIDVLTFKKFNRLGNLSKFWKSLLWIVYAPMLVAGKGYDVIYCDDSYPFYPALVKLVSPKSKVVIRLGDLHLMYYYSGIKYRILHFFEKISWIMADNILPISEAMGAYIASEVSVDRINVVLDPINVDDFTPLKAIKNPEKIVMFHGVITRNKNVDLLIEVAKRLPHIEFWVVGDGPDLERLKALAPENVWFAGWRPYEQMYSFINDCTIGVALRRDNPGNEYVVTSPFLQYGIMGKPCLVTRRKVFGDYYWQFSHATELEEKIKTLMNEPKMAASEGEKLRQYVLKNHDAKKIAEQIWNILTQQS